MPWYLRYLNNSKFDKVNDDKGGGGGGGDKTPTPDAGLEALKTQNAELLKRLDALEKKGNPDPAPKDDDLAEKARKEREKNEKSQGDSKQLESAIRFTLGAKDWLKTNESLLPKSIQSIFDMADKEVYSNAVEKDSAIKLGIISEFFAQQANADLLTPSQKSALEDFQKLTKTVKQERSQQFYDSVFEPTFEMLKRIKKAEQLSKGISTPSDSEAAYKQKLMNGSKKFYLGDK